MADICVKSNLVCGGVSLVLSVAFAICFTLMYGDYSLEITTEMDELSSQLNNLNLSIRVKNEEPLSDAAKKRVIEIVHQEMAGHCSHKATNNEILKVMHTFIDGNSQSAKREYLHTKRARGHLTSKTGTTTHPRRGENKIAYWGHDTSGNTYLCHGVELLHHSTLIVPTSGSYYIYNQIKYEYHRHQNASLHRHVTYLLPSWSTNSRRIPVFENTYYLGDESRDGDSHLGNKISHQAGVIELEKGDRLFVTSRTGHHTKLVTSGTNEETFFGLFLVS